MKKSKKFLVTSLATEHWDLFHLQIQLETFLFRLSMFLLKKRTHLKMVRL